MQDWNSLSKSQQRKRKAHQSWQGNNYFFCVHEMEAISAPDFLWNNSQSAKLVICCNCARASWPCYKKKHEEFMADNWPAPNDLEDTTDQKRKAEIT